ncbi:MAG: hypothetical protein R3C15_08685 [Thermoleophilia bacterium]
MNIAEWYERAAQEWPPRDLAFKAALRRGAQELLTRGYGRASRAFADASRLAEGDDRELARGLVHLAAAGHRLKAGEADSATRQLAHARRRLAPALGRTDPVDVASLVAAVERDPGPR